MVKPFNLFAEFGKFGLTEKISIRDPNARLAFFAHVERSIDQALADQNLIHGQRAETMFGAMLVSLDEYALLKSEDSGTAYPSDKFIVPDFRVVLKDGVQWLIEVKNVYIADASRQERRLMTRDYREKLAAYAAATGGQLKLAIYWAKWRIWTLVSPEKLVDANGDVTLSMSEALKVNEMGRLGDRMIGTKPPLRIRLFADPEKTSLVAPDGTVNITIGGAKIFCDQAEIVDPIEQEIAWMFMNYGQWEEAESEVKLDGDKLIYIEFRWEPAARQNEGFEIVGTLSRMFAQYFLETTTKDREVIQLQAPMRPGWFAPLVANDYRPKELPLWRFILQENYERPVMDSDTVSK